jgi:hypothetical protein
MLLLLNSFVGKSLPFQGAQLKLVSFSRAVSRSFPIQRAPSSPALHLSLSFSVGVLLGLLDGAFLLQALRRNFPFSQAFRSSLPFSCKRLRRATLDPSCTALGEASSSWESSCSSRFSKVNTSHSRNNKRMLLLCYWMH